MGKEGFKAIHLIRPFLSIIPQVQSVSRRITIAEKYIYTGVSVFVYLICSKLPLYGIQSVTGADPLYWTRAILASKRGTLMELGISPIMTSGLVMQLLVGSKLIKVDNSVKEERELFNGAQKMLGMLIAVGQAVMYVLGGMYGSVNTLGVGNAILIIAQLSIASFIMICLDELLQKGYGFGSGMSLFTATNTCETIAWKSLSPTVINTDRGSEVEGAIFALFQSVTTRTNKIQALTQVFYRQHLPNMWNLLATVAIFLLVISLQGFQIIVPIVKSHSDRQQQRRGSFAGKQGSYPIKLLYTSTMPIILHSALVSNLFLLSQFLYTTFGGNFLVNLLGQWKESGGHLTHVAGLISYINAPYTLADLAAHPFHGLVYLAFTLSSCAFFSTAWLQFSGSSSKDVANQLKEQQMVIPGHRESNMKKELDRYIPTAAALGGICIGGLTIVADLTGAIGSGTGILLSVATISTLFETLEKERASEQGIFGR